MLAVPPRIAASIAAAIMLLAATHASAGPAVLFEPEGGKVYYSEDADMPWYPASLTKLMTAYVSFEALKDGTITTETQLVCSKLANEQSPSKVGLPVGGVLDAGTGIRALIIKSANDVAIMLAEKIGGSVDGFVGRMNTTARRLGMTHTHFSNPNGLPDPANVTTARDMALLARAILRDYPQYAHLYAEREMALGTKKLGSHNSLLKTFEGADGMKTGFICDSGYNIVASATRNKLKMIAVVFGQVSAGHRSHVTSDMLQHAFDTHEWKETFGGLPTLETLPLENGGTNAAPSIRTKVLAWACGYRDPNAPKKKKKVKKGRGKDVKVKDVKAKDPKSKGDKAKASGKGEATDKPGKSAVKKVKAPAEGATAEPAAQ